jgi:hypothetical protein
VCAPTVDQPNFEPFDDRNEESESVSDTSRPEFVSSMQPPSNESRSLIAMVLTARQVPFSWQEVEGRLALQFPNDYKELMDALGPGSFRDIHVGAPDWPVPEYNLADLAERANIADAMFPAHHMIPWGWTDDGLTFMWDRDVDDPDDWTVFIAQPGFFEYRMLQVQNQRLSMTSLLAHYLADPLSVVPRLVNPLTRTVVDPRLPPDLPPFTPAPEKV